MVIFLLHTRIFHRTRTFPVFCRWCLFALIATFLAISKASASEGSIAVLYPDVERPYLDVFQRIMDGVEAQTDGVLFRYPVRGGQDVAKISREIEQNHVKAVISLGRQGSNAAARLQTRLPIIAGGVLSPAGAPAGESVISMSPDPALLFSWMKRIFPGLKRVFVAYDPRYGVWLINLAKKAAIDQGLELISHESGDTRDAVVYYQDFFRSADPRTDGLWLPDDPTTTDDGVVLPMVLQESWDMRIAVFSGSISHVRRGVLFALYPDNFSLGKRLSLLAQKSMTPETSRRASVMPLRDVRSAINIRTASHLSIDTDQTFTTTFPQ